MCYRLPLLLLMLSLSAGAPAAVQIGQAAPDFTGTDTDGRQHRLSDYRGKYVVLEWTNHDCPYVRKHYGAGNMQAQQREAAQLGVVWLSVISSAPGKQGHVSPAQADQLTAVRDAEPSAILLDEAGEIGRLYSAKTTPHMYLVDPQGKLVYMGGIDSIASANPDDIGKATQHLRVALNEALNGKPVGVPVTRPYGCSVKY